MTRRHPPAGRVHGDRVSPGHRGRGAARVARVAVIALTGALVLSACHGATRGVRGAPRRRTARDVVASAWSRPVPLGPSDLAGDEAGVVVLSGDARVTAFDSSGHERWTRAVGGAGTNLDPPALDREGVAVGAADRLVVLDRGNGALRWEADVPGEVGVAAFAHPRDGAPVVLSSTYAGDLEARDATDGTPRWRVSRPGEVRARLALSGDEHVVVAMWSETGTSVLRALDVASGAVLWERALEIGTSAPVVSGGVVVIGSGDGNFHAAVDTFALGNGVPGPRVAVPASFEPELEPAVDGGDVIVVDQLGTVTAVDPVAGVERWHADLGESVLRTRVVVGVGRIAVSTAAGAVVWLERETGRVVRRLDPAGGYARQIAGRPGQLLVALGRTDPERVEAFPL